MKKKTIGKLNNIIYFEEAIENSYTKDSLGGYNTIWIPALGEVVDTAEVGTTTTNITMTAHGMASGDYIINTSRSENVKAVTYVDASNVTVVAITGQTTGDTIKKRIYELSRVWASITPSNDSFYAMEDQKKTTKVTHKVEIRFRTDITTKMRIKFGVRYFEIISIATLDEDGERLLLKCRELTL
jgi:SPP1 family predicted phage head-tail adaptor